MTASGTNDSQLRLPHIIASKRDGKALSPEQIHHFVKGVVSGSVAAEQIGALLMAIYCKGMDWQETTELTSALLHSGTTLSWDTPHPIVDKHSTGGVGDKISLVLAPALAACGCWVPMISGRGLGHTGGTLDKLEAIPGFSVSQSKEDMEQILSKAGACIVGQTELIVPGDRILYAARDITSTVGSLPLIVASIMSKKVAEGLQHLVLDIKVGSAAFMQTEKQARELAEAMVEVGCNLNIETTAVLTEMDCPIGKAVGNAVEVVESIRALKGEGPADLLELVTVEGGQLLMQAGLATNLEHGRELIANSLQDGTALKAFRTMCEAQGVSSDTAAEICEQPEAVLLKATKQQTTIKASTSGFVQHIEAMPLAEVLGELGAGRQHPVSLNIAVEPS
ncbi:uncharacterized protein MONBRDRAFT_31810 [Monosiga brevicollis MX1]|uniref:Thymidine phosphorylase n=1 Tax=Monosiga brevicollis TaxID=81824 RepID=A9UVJ2_MONBE|nr:uncharacterized protein MONBRDRAFT_31810 [Monosiga brevicollis MX1]EDQ90590.1 predicted protein [Monosiga brevicollis MX1]|eukprot:XP_001744641.1 hypothetical protein [Monosiga brevicollis MX1]